jgi:hypothetical protein
MTTQEAIDLLSIAARSSTWSGASPELARELLEVLRARWDPVVQSVIDERDEALEHQKAAEAETTRLGARLLECEAERDEARTEVNRLNGLLDLERSVLMDERDEARAEVERLKSALATSNDTVVSLSREYAAEFERLEAQVERLLIDTTQQQKDIHSIAAQRDEARAEVERLKHEVTVLEQALESSGFESHLAECVNADPRPTPPVDVPDLGPRVKNLEQPMPTGGGQEVFPVALEECTSKSLCEMLAARDLVGRQRYGSSLKTHNGRDVLRDAREELADAYVYLVQKKLEATQTGGLTWHLDNALDSIELAWEQLGDAK